MLKGREKSSITTDQPLSACSLFTVRSSFFIMIVRRLLMVVCCSLFVVRKPLIVPVLFLPSTLQPCSELSFSLLMSSVLEHQIQSGLSMPIDDLGDIWMRHAAMRGVSNQCGWSLLLPIYGCDEPPVRNQVFLMHKLLYVRPCKSRRTPAKPRHHK